MGLEQACYRPCYVMLQAEGDDDDVDGGVDGGRRVGGGRGAVLPGGSSGIELTKKFSSVFVTFIYMLGKPFFVCLFL